MRQGDDTPVGTVPHSRRGALVCVGMALVAVLLHALTSSSGPLGPVAELCLSLAPICLSIAMLAKAWTPGVGRPGLRHLSRWAAVLAMFAGLALTWAAFFRQSGPGWHVDASGTRVLVAARPGGVPGVLFVCLAVFLFIPLRRRAAVLIAGGLALFAGMSALYVIAGHVYIALRADGGPVQLATSLWIGIALAALAGAALVSVQRGSAALASGWLRAAIIIALFLPMIGTWHLWRLAVVAADQMARSDFDRRGERIEKQIVGEMAKYERTLIDSASVLGVVKDMDRATWRRYVEGLRLPATMPGVRGVGYAAMVFDDDAPELVAAMRAQGLPKYEMWPASDAHLRVPVTLLEPADGPNLQVMGFDLMSEPTRKAALDCALERRRPCASGTVTLVQDQRDHPQPGFLLIMAVHPGGVDAPVAGFVYMSFRAWDLLGAMQHQLDPDVHVRIYDGRRPGVRSLMYDSLASRAKGDVPPGKAVYASLRVIPVMGRPWTLELRAMPPIEANAMAALPNASRYGFAVISLLSLVCAVLLAVERSAALERSREDMRRLEELNAKYEAQHQQLTQSHHQTQAQQQRIAAALEEKETLLREVYHRVKNNLQVIQSLLSLQRRTIPEGATAHAIDDTVLRVKAMSLVHEKLYQSGNLAAVSLQEYTADLIAQLAEAGGARQRHIQVHSDVEPIMTGLDSAVPFGLLLNELVSNCFKHAFPTGEGGDIWITLHKEDPHVVLTVSDNGVGLPEGFTLQRSRSMGLRLVVSLAKQLGAAIEVVSGPCTAFRAVITRL